MPFLDPYAKEDLSIELFNGETLLWAAQPNPGFIFRIHDLFLTPFGIVLIAFGSFWLSVLNSGIFFLIVPGLFLVFFGIFLAAGRYFYDKRYRETAAYGITGQRIIIKSGVLSKRVYSFAIQTIKEISFTKGKNKSGTIIIGPKVSGRYTIGPGNTWSLGVPNLMEEIEDVKNVYDLIFEVRKKMKAERYNVEF
ncbi:PH domain-containing protein [Mucilaginibacter sp. McL0603]|uniref:PH domain-containing protein n=1 Tax=Mucilaginibacter sp. McL0603 TaxID=3415670 RepID=UPI003CF063D5